MAPFSARTTLSNMSGEDIHLKNLIQKTMGVIFKHLFTSNFNLRQDILSQNHGSHTAEPHRLQVWGR